VTAIRFSYAGPKDRWLRVEIEELTGRLLRGAEQPSPMDRRGYL
jgi:hypothetical protein